MREAEILDLIRIIRRMAPGILKQIDKLNKLFILSHQIRYVFFFCKQI